MTKVPATATMYVLGLTTKDLHSQKGSTLLTVMLIIEQSVVVVVVACVYALY
jgi:hypothetical protein